MDHEFGSHKRHDLHRAAFDTYKVITPCNVYSGEDIMSKTIKMGSIIVRVEMRDIRHRVCITNCASHAVVASWFRVLGTNLYQTTFTELCRADAANFVQCIEMKRGENSMQKDSNVYFVDIAKIRMCIG